MTGVDLQQLRHGERRCALAMYHASVGAWHYVEQGYVATADHPYLALPGNIHRCLLLRTYGKHSAHDMQASSGPLASYCVL